MVLTFDGAAAYMAATPRQIQRWVNEGKLPAIKLPGRGRRILGPRCPSNAGGRLSLAVAVHAAEPQACVMTQIKLAGSFEAVSSWDLTDERTGPPASLREREWRHWHKLLKKQPKLVSALGGRDIANSLFLMYIPPGSFPSPRVRGAALGWPVRAGGEWVNLIRRYLDDREPRYQGLGGRGH